jgi:hypothetical protein
VAQFRAYVRPRILRGFHAARPLRIQGRAGLGDHPTSPRPRPAHRRHRSAHRSQSQAFPAVRSRCRASLSVQDPPLPLPRAAAARTPAGRLHQSPPHRHLVGAGRSFDNPNDPQAIPTPPLSKTARLRIARRLFPWSPRPLALSEPGVLSTVHSLFCKTLKSGSKSKSKSKFAMYKRIWRARFKEGERGFAKQCISRAFHAKQCISRVTVRKTLWIRKAVHFTCFRG